jgi:hypothetical protein
MDSATEGRTKALAILAVTALAGLLWLVSLLLTYTDFQSTWLTDPLAELRSLSPTYWAAVALAALAGVGCFVWRVESRGVHVFVLTVLAAILWLTPYLLAGFVRLPDAPWHVGAAVNIPEVLSGEPIVLGEYAWSYPASYVYHFGVMELVDAEPFTYIDLFPIFSMLAFVLLCYALVARLFDARVGLLAMLVAFPGLHYLQLHASPHVVAALLMLTALLLLAVGRGAARVVPVIVALVALAIAAHPTTPLLIGIFIAAALLVSVVQRRRIGHAQVVLAGLLVLAMAGWFFWYSYHPGWEWATAEGVYESLEPDRLGTSAETMTGLGFVYGGIFDLNRAIYVLYGAAGLLTVAVVAAGACFRATRVWPLISGLFGLERNEAIVAVSVVPLLILTFLLAAWTHVLIETGLTYMILAISCIVASVAVRKQRLEKRAGQAVAALVVLFLAFTSPVVAYSIDGYSSFPRSEEVGVAFLAERGAMDGREVMGTGLDHLGTYDQSLLAGAVFIGANSKGAPTVSRAKPDMVVFRKTGYYYSAMRLDLSFEDNRWTRNLDHVEGAGYNKVYSSPTFDIYLDD